MEHYKPTTVEFTEDWKFDGVFLPVSARRSVMQSHTKRYHNCLYLLAGLHSCPRDLMDYLTERMDNNNEVYISESFRQQFLDLMLSNAKQKYSHSSVKRALGILVEKGLIRRKERGKYLIAPEYFIKNSDGKRLHMIKMELEFKSGQDTKFSKLYQMVKGIENEDEAESRVAIQEEYEKVRKKSESAQRYADRVRKSEK